MQLNITIKESICTYEEKKIGMLLEKLGEYEGDVIEIGLKEQKLDLEFLHKFLTLKKLLYNCLNEKVMVQYKIQTSEVALEAWELRLLSAKEVVVCLLMDGTESVHEGNNALLNRTGTHAQALQAAAFLTNSKVNFYIGITVTSLVAVRIHEVFQFLTNHHWNSQAYWTIECETNPEKTKDLLTAEDYGFFLKELFKLWKNMRMDGKPVYVREMENFAGRIKGFAPLISSVGGQCPSQNLFFPNGEIYTRGCMAGQKEYLNRKLKEQNLHSMNTVDVKTSCKVCRWVSLCQSDQICCKNTNIFCNVYKEFYAFALPEMFELLRKLGK